MLMKKIKIVFLLLSVISVHFSCSEQRKQISGSGNNLPGFIKNGSSSDSGFITKEDGLPYLLKEKLTDTINSFWIHAAINDTIGKFYRVETTGNYLVSTINLSSKLTFETHLLFEISKNGKLL